MGRNVDPRAKRRAARGLPAEHAETHTPQARLATLDRPGDPCNTVAYARNLRVAVMNTPNARCVHPASKRPSPGKRSPAKRSRSRWRRRPSVVAVAVALSLPGAYALANPEELVTLRTEVDDLASELSAVRSTTRGELAQLRAERDALTRRLKRARADRAAVSDQAERKAKRLRALEARSARWIAPLRAAVARAKRHVETSLPFRRAARVAELTRLERRLDGAAPDPVAITRELWRIVEQEASLTGEVGVGRQVATIDGARQLVEVIRLGDALLYFRTAGGAVGLVVVATDDQSGDAEATWTVVDDENGRAAIASLFDLALGGERLGPVRLIVPSAPLR